MPAQGPSHTGKGKSDPSAFPPHWKSLPGKHRVTQPGGNKRDMHLERSTPRLNRELTLGLKTLRFCSQWLISDVSYPHHIWLPTLPKSHSRRVGVSVPTPPEWGSLKQLTALVFIQYDSVSPPPGSDDQPTRYPFPLGNRKRLEASATLSGEEINPFLSFRCWCCLRRGSKKKNQKPQLILSLEKMFKVFYYLSI